MSPGLKWGVILVFIFCVGALVWHFSGKSPESPVPVTEGEPAQSNTTMAKVPTTRPPPPLSSTGSAATVPLTTGALVTAAISTGPVDPAIHALVVGLKSLGGTNALTAESVAAWRTNFALLVQSGPAGVAALKGFLDEKIDFPFSSEAWQELGYSSARVAAIDALRQIGGHEAIAVMENLLGSTQTPREVALLARNLEEAQPGAYRQQALAAARSGLQAAAQANSPNVDVAPLFEVFQHYGDASAVADLERATKPWNYYATIALADLPDGAGIPSILRMAETGSNSRILSLEMVAQLAPNNQVVKEFLLAQAADNKIPANLWVYLSGPLAGDQYFPVDSAITAYPQIQSRSDVRTTRIFSGNQNVYMLPGYLSMTPDELAARTALVEQLLQSAKDPAAQQALQRARDTLARRTLRASSIAQPGASSGTSGQ